MTRLQVKCEVAWLLEQLRARPDASLCGTAANAIEQLEAEAAAWQLQVQAGRGMFSQAWRDVVNERARQVTVEGYDEAHDDAHSEGTLATQAAALALREYSYRHFWEPHDGWGLAAKHNNRRRRLVIAAALLLAEVERFDRMRHPRKDPAT